MTVHTTASTGAGLGAGERVLGVSSPAVPSPGAAGALGAPVAPGAPAADLEVALERLQAGLGELGRVVVAFSGGVDSAFLARIAHQTLGRDRTLCVTALSPSLAGSEEEDCRALAAEWGLRWRGVPTAEMDDPDYVANGPDRCAHCKSALMDVLVPLALSERAAVVLGVNVDDLGEHRPGQRAAAAAGARFPLVEAGFSKAAVREWSHRLGLRTWDKPAAACLASRIPYGTPVTIGTLRSVGQAEAALHAMGLVQLRVRHHGPVARVEVPDVVIDEVVARRREVVAAVRAAGYLFVTLDLEGFRSGSLNRLLAGTQGVGAAASGP